MPTKVEQHPPHYNPWVNAAECWRGDSLERDGWIALGVPDFRGLNQNSFRFKLDRRVGEGGVNRKVEPTKKESTRRRTILSTKG